MSVLPLEADIHQGDGYVSFVPILLQKSAAADGRSAIPLREAGFDAPAMTPSTQL
jgi:hypothetical protein